MKERLLYFLERIYTINWTESDAKAKYNYQLSMMIDTIISNNRDAHLKRKLKEDKTPYLAREEKNVYLDTDTIIINETDSGRAVTADNIIKTIEELIKE